MSLIPHTSRLGVADFFYGSTFGPVITYVPGGSVVTAGTVPPGMIVFADDIGGTSHVGIQGTPSATGVYNFSTDSLMSNGSHNLFDWVVTVALVVGCPVINISPATLHDGYQGLPYSQLLTGDAGVQPYTFDLVTGALPTGLTLDATGLLHGIPTVQASFSFTIRLRDASGSACTAMAVYTVAILTPVEVDVDIARDISGQTVPLVWVEWTLDDASIESYAKVPLLDPQSYFGGYKRPMILSFGEIKRALSDRTGQLEGAAFSWVASDLDARIRSLLFGLTTQYNFVNRKVVARMISDIERRLLRVPRTIFRGVLRDYNPREERKFEFNAEDFLSAKISPFNLDRVIPRRFIGDVFLDAPIAVRTKRLPLIYGSASDEASTTPAPVLTGTTARGAFTNGGRWIGGFGNLASAAAVPVGVIVTVNAAASGALSADVQNSEYGFIVTAVDAGGNESDPSTFYYNGPGEGRGSFAFGPIASTGVVPDSTRSITVSWTASAAAVKYRVYLGTYYYGARWGQFIEVNAPTVSVTFDKHWGFSVTNPTAADLSTGAQFVNFAQHWEYAVLAVKVDGVTALSDWQWSDTGPYPRPPRLEWLAVAGATEYRVLRRAMFGDWDRQWTVAAGTLFFEDDLHDTGVTIINGTPTPTGIIPLTYTGTEVVSGFPWHRYLVQQGCAQDILGLYVDGSRVEDGNYGVLWLVPRKAGWPLAHNYVDVNGVRCTVVYGRGPQSDAIVSGSSALTANVKGIEDVSDGSGALISSLLQIYKHFIVNFGLQDSDGGIGGWLAAPELEPGLSQVDEASFDAADAVAADRLAGGFPGTAVIGANDEALTLRDVIQRFNRSADVRSGFNRNSQFFVTMLDLRIATLSAARAITQQLNIISASFSIAEKVDELFNVGVYSYGRNYKTNAWLVENASLTDADSVTNYRETKKTPTIELWYVRSGAVAAEIINRAVIFTRHVPRRVIWSEPLSGLQNELGDIVRLTHVEGVGPNGYAGNPVWIDRHDFDPNQFKVRHEAYDVYRLFAGGFVLGDDTWGVNWLTASPQQRLYGFLCNEATSVFSDGTEGKRLR